MKHLFMIIFFIFIFIISVNMMIIHAPFNTYSSSCIPDVISENFEGTESFSWDTEPTSVTWASDPWGGSSTKSAKLINISSVADFRWIEAFSLTDVYFHFHFKIVEAPTGWDDGDQIGFFWLAGSGSSLVVQLLAIYRSADSAFHFYGKYQENVSRTGSDTAAITVGQWYEFYGHYLPTAGGANWVNVFYRTSGSGSYTLMLDDDDKGGSRAIAYLICGSTSLTPAPPTDFDIEMDSISIDLSGDCSIEE